MPPPAPLRRWPGSVVALHWCTAIVVAAGVLAICWRDETEARALRALLLAVHRHAGLLVLVLTLVRLTLRVLRPERPPVAGGALARGAAAAAHAALYLLLIAVPLLGWALSDARGVPWRAFGMAWPPLAAPDEDRADDLVAWHALAAWGFVALVGLHAAAALWHHWVRRDGVLKAMGFRS